MFLSDLYSCVLGLKNEILKGKVLRYVTDLSWEFLQWQQKQHGPTTYIMWTEAHVINLLSYLNGLQTKML